jgi:hypothetical protein
MTSAEGKRMIAKGISSLKRVKNALKKGRIVLKGGTTVSAISEELIGKPMKISGRITTLGTKTGKFVPGNTDPHSLVIEKGKVSNIDEQWEETMARLNPGDCLITGANIIDVYGNAALMAGTMFGSRPGPWIQGAWTEGIHAFIAAGLEKLIPGTVNEVIRVAGRKRVGKSYGMAVGFFPLFGEVFTEIEAIESLAQVECTVIGKGGIFGAEGGTTVLVDGRNDEVSKIEEIYRKMHGSSVSGTAESLVECEAGSPSCKKHIRCLYKSGFQFK